MRSATPSRSAAEAASVETGIPAQFIDLPSTAREMALGDEATQSRSLLSDETPFGVGDYVTALARELSCRDGNEVWDHLFESRIAEPDWATFFADVGQYCACIRGASAAEAAAGATPPPSGASSDKPADDNVVDAEFTEVKEKK